MTALDVRSLQCGYGESNVLADISFQVETGEFFIIIGPNGSGKTTLLKTINGVIRHKAGEIDVLRRPLRDYNRKALARKIALVPQDIPSDFPFTVREVVLMGRAPHQGILGFEKDRDMEIAEAAMAFTRVAHLGKRTLNRLSGGERQRVFIARAICQEPAIILLDEPTASLDLAHQIRIMDLMEKLKAEKNITIAMVSHDVNLAAMYGDRLMLLKDGRIAGIGRPGDVIDFETMEKTYGCVLMVDQSPLGEFPRITLVPQRYLKKQKTNSE